MYSGDPNPCNFDGLKDEEPWVTVCSTAHTLCNGDDNMLKWVTRYESFQGAPSEDYAYFFGPHSINNYDAAMRGENNDYGNNEGDTPPGWAFNPMPTITVTMPKSGLERQLFYQCKHTTSAVMSLYGVNYGQYRTTYKDGDADTCTADACYRDHAIMMTDAATSKRYWISVHGGTVTCSGARFDEVASFGPWVRDRTSSNWVDIQENLDAHLPWHSGHIHSNIINAYRIKMQEGLGSGCEPHYEYSAMFYISATKHQNFYWDMNMKVYPSRIIVEDDSHNLYTWLKFHTYDGPFTSSFDEDFDHTTTCGVGHLTGWDSWLSNYTIREHAQAISYCEMHMGCWSTRSWRMNSNLRTTFAWTDQKVADVSHCHGHIYVPTNGTLDTWTQKACPDARGCIALMFHWNPCVYDFRAGQLKDTDGVVDLDASNITWPRGGSWDSASKTMTFDDNPGLATKDVYPFDSVTLPMHQEFDCSDDGGWFQGSGHSSANWGAQGGDRADFAAGGALNNPGRKRREATRQRRANFDTTVVAADNGLNKVKKLPQGAGVRKYNPNNETETLEALQYFVDYMDTNHTTYFDETGKTAIQLAWMKWGAWNYLVGNTDGGAERQRTVDGHGSIFVGLSDILTYEDSWDIRYPICSGAQCPDSCDIGTTADVRMYCANEINFARYSDDSDGRGNDAKEAYITVTPGTLTPGTSCTYEIMIEVDCDPYIVFFSRNPSEDFHADWNGVPQVLSDPGILIQNYMERIAPATDAPTDAPATDGPATDAPATDAPATDAPTTDGPNTDGPNTEAPNTEAPATDAPATDAPATDAATTAGAAVNMMSAVLLLLCFLF
jgi:hypothetical protein